LKVSVIIASAGSGVRAGANKNKIFSVIKGSTVLEQTYSAFLNSGLVDEIIIVAKKSDFTEIKRILGDETLLVEGGDTRTQSVKNALKMVSNEIVLIHDCARPNISYDLIYKCIESVKTYGSGIAGLPSRDTVSVIKDGYISNYIDRNEICLIQTPQAFYTKDICLAYEKAGDKVYNDDSEVYNEYIGRPKIVEGERTNRKLTYPEDFFICCDKVGVGFDCHQLVENRKLILGGITIPHDKGLLGHSDADVLTHAIMDSLLSALSLRDIGYHFPPSDEKYKDADSMKLLLEVMRMVKENGYAVKNVSAVIMAEKPKLLNFIPQITKNLANALEISTSNVGITATTLEGIGIVGREQAICVHANALVQKL
jgi:2-C-methyl-D-erythritol 2,4-cyclodiphosphate synthase/2-C-methyl-D-erythritol 4-phosphate cytidylyltransferase